jgi:hypothetical protein
MPSKRRSAASRANGAKSRGPATPEGKLRSLANSAQSTGPRTPEGKQRASRNALRHGLLAGSVVLDGESVEMFREILIGLEDELQPDSPIERRFVETMAIAEWRRLRLLSLEKEQFSMEMERQHKAFIETLAAPPGPVPNAGAVPDPPGTLVENAPPAAAVEINPARTLVHAFQVLSGQSRASELLSRYENRHDRQYSRALAGLRAHRAEKRRMSGDFRAAERRRKDRLRKRNARFPQKSENPGNQTK